MVLWLYLLNLIAAAPALAISRPVPATPRCSQQSGDTLERGSTLLEEIAKKFYTHESTSLLAIYLLENIGKGGDAFLERMKWKSHTERDPATSREPNVLARLVLEEWIKHKPWGATKTKLHEILEKVNPGAACGFQVCLNR